MSYQMAKAYTHNLKFKQLMNDVMAILANCYKILMLINRSLDTFLISIYSRFDLDNLYNLLLEIQKNTEIKTKIKSLEEKFSMCFSEALVTAHSNKKKKRELINLNENNKCYLLYNIYQSNDIITQIQEKMEALLKILLDCAPDSVILTLFLDTTLKNKGFGNIVATECKKRRNATLKDNTKDPTKNFCIVPGDYKDSIKKIEETERAELLKNEDDKKNVKTMLSNFFSNGIKKFKLAKKLIKDSIKKSKEIAESEEKMMDALTILSVINGLFFALKAQYDEIMNYYERNLDNLSECTNNNQQNNNNQKDNNNQQNNENQKVKTHYEKTRYLIDYSREYINFMVPPQLQSIITATINEFQSEEIQKSLEDVTKLIKEEHDEVKNNEALVALTNEVP